MTENRFRRVLGRVADGWKASAGPPASEPDERFVMKPGEVRILRGGGARIVRRPGEPRDAG